MKNIKYANLPSLTVGIFCGCFLLNASFQPGSTNKIQAGDPSNMAQQAIFLYLSQPTPYDGILCGRGLAKIDPVLRTRDTIWGRGKEEYCFIDPMHDEQLIYPLPKEIFQLTIPDSLTGKYQYTEPGMYNGLDHAFIYLFSPLLPTKTPGIFLIACFTWGNGCSAEDRIRAVFRNYLIFKVENKQITYVDQLDQGEDANDFCGFGF